MFKGKISIKNMPYYLPCISTASEDKAPFHLDLAKNYQSYVDDYAISANFLLMESYSRWLNLCAMWHLFKCGNS